MRRRFELQGHRGARGLFPENTIEGFRRTIEYGVDSVELDIALTADGVPVVFHDVAINPAIARGRDGQWIAAPGPTIFRLTASDVAAFDVGRLRPGSAYARRYPDQLPCDGEHIPTLAEVLAVTVPAGVRVDAELKTLPGEPERTAAPERMADAVVAVGRGCGAMGLLDIRSFDWRGLRAVRANYPDVPVTYLTNATSEANPALWWNRALDRTVARTVASECAHATWAPEYPTLTRAAVDEAHDLGLRVVPWTVNDPKDIARMIAWRVDGICTDRPDRAREVMRVAGLSLP